MEEAFKALLSSNPVLGALIIILIIGFVAVAKLLLAEKDKRIADAEKTRDTVAEPLRQIKESIERMEGKIVISKRAEQNETLE